MLPRIYVAPCLLLLGLASGCGEDTGQKLEPWTLEEICEEPTVFYPDEDGDGFGVDDPARRVEGCQLRRPPGYVAKAGDCDDMDSRRSPANRELCDEVDNNCDNQLNNGIECVFYAHTGEALYTVDPFQLKLTKEASVPNLFDIDTHPDGTLYGLNGNDFYRYEANTKTWRRIGPLNANDPPNGMAISPEGRVFATGGSSLYEIDIDTGAAKLVGDLGGDYESSGDCVVFGERTLFMTSRNSNAPGDNLVRVDQQTGKATKVGNTRYAQIYGLTTAWGKLFGVTSSGSVVEINPVTGEGELYHTFGGIGWYGAASTIKK